MKISSVFVCLILSLTLWVVNSAIALNSSGDVLKQSTDLTEERTGAEGSTEASSVKCKLQATNRLPAFSMDGDYVIGGVFSIHYYKHTVNHNYTTKPEPQRCKGR